MAHNLNLLFLVIGSQLVFAQESSPGDIAQLNEAGIAQIRKASLEFEEATDGQLSFSGEWKRLGLKDMYVENATKDSRTRRITIFLDRGSQREKRMRIPDVKKLDQIEPHQAYGAFGLESPLGRYHTEFSLLSRLGLKFHVFGQDDTLTLGELVSESSNARLAEEAVVGDDECKVLEIDRFVAIDDRELFVRVFVAPQKNHLVKKIEIYFGKDDQADKFEGTIELESVGKGVFAPVAATWELIPAGKTKAARTISFKTMKRAFNDQVELGSLAYDFPKKLWVQKWNVPFNALGPGEGMGHALSDGKGGFDVEFLVGQNKEYGEYRRKMIRENSPPSVEVESEAVDAEFVDPRRSRLGQMLFQTFAVGSILISLFIAYRIVILWHQWRMSPEEGA